MSKFLSQKKKLIEDVFEKASNDATEQSFSGILKSLENTLKEDFRIILSYKTFENYYNSLVIREEDYNIKLQILDELCIYLGYKNFKEYCAEWKTIEFSVKESISNIVINIINKPLLKMPEFLTKQSGVGVLGLLVIGGFFAGNKFIDKNENHTENDKYSIINSPVSNSHLLEQRSIQENISNVEKIRIVENKIQESKEPTKHYMYWNGEKFIATADAHLGTRFKIIPMDEFKFKNFRKIMKPDTIALKHVNKIWYSKYKNNVEFFTEDGSNPENDKELKRMSYYIFTKYVENN